jgi:flagellar motor protein MotB
LSRRQRAPLFPVNVWPPFVDALTLVLAAFVVVILVALVAQRGLVSGLRERDQELSRLREDKARIERRLRAIAPRGTIQIEEGKVILQGEVLFDSGSDALRADGARLMNEIGRSLSGLLAAEPTQMVLVGGHTDTFPIHDSRFASNWELSTARAVAVTRVLMTAGLPPGRVVAAGFGEFHPRAPNADEAGRRQNRRIEVSLVPITAVSSR